VHIDTVGPTTAVKPASGHKGNAIALKCRVSDNLSPRATSVTLTIRNSHKKVVKTLKLGTEKVSAWYAVKWTPKAKGTYRYTVYAKDLAGNKQAKAGSAKITVK
jgi:flagellar hook assembly protein FlgD